MGKKVKRGYLKENFQLFHIKDQREMDFEYHYHDFKKIIIFLSGKVTYLIEGKAYFLKPWDLLLVNNEDVHKPVIDANVPYERVVIWINPDYMETQNHELEDITTCFSISEKRSFNMIRLESKMQLQVQSLVAELESSLKSKEFGSGMLSNALFIQLMVYINRVFLDEQYVVDENSLKYDEQVEKILQYINQNLEKDLTNDHIADQFFLNKYYLMHKFKDETGYTLHHYIQQKRLLQAKHKIREGNPIVKTSLECGFKDYSTFLRAYKKMFGHAPKEELKKVEQKRPCQEKTLDT